MPEYYGEKPFIAHCVYAYLPLTQTWIYQYIKNHKMVRPVVLTNRLQDSDKFPFKNVYSLYRYPPNAWKRYSWWWFWRNLKEKILGLRPDELGFYRKVILDNKVKLLQAHFGYAGVSVLPLKRELDLPLVTAFYGFDISKLVRQQDWVTKYRELFEEGDLFLVEGEYMRKKVIELGCSPRKVKLQRIPINIDDYQFMPRSLPKGNDNLTVLLCGRFVEKKGIPYAIKAVSIAREHYLNVKLRIVGDGELRPEIEKLIKQFKLEKHVSLLGYLPHPEYIKELKMAHILIAPSVTAVDGDSEGGAPTVLLEAQASGMPVLSTYHADIPNVVAENRSGFLVPERNAEALAEKLVYLIEHHEIWGEMGEAGRKYVEGKHNIHFEIDRLESRYINLLSKFTS